MFSWQINGWILKDALVKVKQEVWKMAGLAEVDDVDGAARYIGKYLHMQSYHVRKYIMSAGWVFPGWVSWSKRFKRKHGVYPDQMYPGILAKLARMSKREREDYYSRADENGRFIMIYLLVERRLNLRLAFLLTCA